MSTLTIAFAGSRYRFAGLNPEQDGLARSRFQGMLSSDAEKPDVRTDIHFNPNSAAFMRRPYGPVEYPLAVAHGDASIAVAGVGFTANIDRRPLRVQMQTCLSDDWFLAAFENLFRIVSCYRLFDEGALVMHSAAFHDDGRGFVLCGRSGAGKTTLCGLADELDLQILSDELNAVRPTGGSFELLAMPFAGDFGRAPRRHPPYPVTGLLGLRQGGAPSVSLCSKAEAVSRVVASCPYVNADPCLVDRLTSRAEQLVERLPLRVLTFAKDPRFWSVLNNEYREPTTAISR
ncbi:MAG: hypothetical protein HKN10_17500 [Myxococcales bacterium]|nr:hypothetical protein [Deltaproteobacteria bacterium]NNE20268.1 hypothetical protein [Myxococcales bacterium]